METLELVKLAKQIVSLDQKRDELYEELMLASGNRGEDVLRAVQNGMIRQKEGSY